MDNDGNLTVELCPNARIPCSMQGKKSKVGPSPLHMKVMSKTAAAAKPAAAPKAKAPPKPKVRAYPSAVSVQA